MKPFINPSIAPFTNPSIKLLPLTAFIIPPMIPPMIAPLIAALSPAINIPTPNAEVAGIHIKTIETIKTTAKAIH